jgi:multiple sugar transport system permease protein
LFGNYAYQLQDSQKKKKISILVYFILPAVIMLALFTLFPIVYSIRTSFLSWNLIKPHLGKRFIGFDNYVKMFSDPRFWNSLKISFIFVAGSTCLSTALGLGIAMLLNRSFKGNVFFRLVFLLPMFITPVVVGIMWRFMLNAELGLVNYLLSLVGIKQVGWFSHHVLALTTVMLIDVWEWTPFVILICLSGLQSLPHEPFEAAVIDGANGWKIFRFITIPLIKPLLLTVIIIRTMDTFRVFDIIFVTTRGGPGVTTENLNLYGFINAFEYYHVGYSTTITFFLLIMIILISMFYTKMIKVNLD